MGTIGMPWKAEAMAGAGGRRTLMRTRRGPMQIMARPAGERGCAQEIPATVKGRWRSSGAA